jgi:hypothetical protein
LFVLEFRDFLSECQEKNKVKVKPREMSAVYFTGEVKVKVKPREISGTYFTGEVEVNGIIETSGVSFEYLNAEGV